MDNSGVNKNLFMLAAGLLVGTGLGLLILVIYWRMEPGESILEGGLRAGVSLPAPIVGSPAPDFELELLDGQYTTLSNYRGQPVLLNFWATWCGPCEVEMPFFQSQYEQHGSNFSILAINNAEQAHRVQQFVDRHALTFPVLLDQDASVQKLYQVRGYPTSLLVDAEGIIRVYHVGVMSEKQLSKYLQELGVGG
jgi:peroxiredoxin